MDIQAGPCSHIETNGASLIHDSQSHLAPGCAAPSAAMRMPRNGQTSRARWAAAAPRGRPVPRRRRSD
eukprot:483437-Prymnesium_polylepis.1